MRACQLLLFVIVNKYSLLPRIIYSKYWLNPVICLSYMFSFIVEKCNKIQKLNINFQCFKILLPTNRPLLLCDGYQLTGKKKNWNTTNKLVALVSQSNLFYFDLFYLLNLFVCLLTTRLLYIQTYTQYSTLTIGCIVCVMHLLYISRVHFSFKWQSVKLSMYQYKSRKLTEMSKIVNKISWCFFILLKLIQTLSLTSYWPSQVKPSH